MRSAKHAYTIEQATARNKKLGLRSPEGSKMNEEERDHLSLVLCSHWEGGERPYNKRIGLSTVSPQN